MDLILCDAVDVSFDRGQRAPGLESLAGHVVTGDRV